MPTKDLIAVRLPEQASTIIERIQDDVERRWGIPSKMGPHITLVIPYTMDLKELLAGELIAGLARATWRYQQAEIEVGGVHHYQDGERNVVGLKVSDPSRTLRNLQKRCRRVVFGVNLPPRIPLHMTIADGLNSAQAQELKGDLESLDLSWRFLVDKIYWLNKGHEEREWSSVGSLQLRK